MPRTPRIKGENLIYHIVQRGHDKKNIFLSAEDKRRYLDTLKTKMKNDDFQIYAFCLMDNHVHILIKVGHSDISDLMKKINVSYAMYFNNKYSRYGHLFQNRFKSEIVNTDSYLLQASKYIHMNPVKAHMVNKPEDYEWSSYRTYINQSKTPLNIVNQEPVLNILSDNKNDSINKYKAFVLTENIMEPSYKRFMNMESKEESKKLDYEIADMIIKEHFTNKKQAVIDIKKKTGLTTREISKKVGVSPATISRIFNNL